MMKKIFIFLCFVFVSLAVNAAGQLTKEKVIKRAKAIAARHVIINKKGKLKDDNKEATNAKDVDALEKLIISDTDEYFKKICEDIDDYEVDDKDTSSLFNSFQVLLYKYNVTDKGALNQIKVPIRNSRLFNNKGTSNPPVTNESEENEGDVEDNTDPLNKHPEVTESTGTFIDPQKVTSNESKDKNKVGILSLLPIVVLSLALLGSLYCCFQLWRKNKDLEKERSKIRESLRKITDRVNSNYAKMSPDVLADKLNAVINTLIIKEKTPLEEKIKELEKRNKELEESERAAKKYNSDYKPYSSNDRGIGYGYAGSYGAKSEEPNSSTLTKDIQNENSNNSIYEPEPLRATIVGKEMFLYLPNDNMFKDGSEEYRSGKTLYKMVYTSEETADFEFVNRPEALAFAKQSRSRFLEGACFIENDDAISFSTIQTLEKGKLVKADEGWNIISKARIRLS